MKLYEIIWYQRLLNWNVKMPTCHPEVCKSDIGEWGDHNPEQCSHHCQLRWVISILLLVLNQRFLGLLPIHQPLFCAHCCIIIRKFTWERRPSSTAAPCTCPSWSGWGRREHRRPANQEGWRDNFQCSQLNCFYYSAKQTVHSIQW